MKSKWLRLLDFNFFLHHDGSGFYFDTQDAQMAKAHLESNSWRQKKEQMTDEKEKLVAHVDLLKRLVVSM